MGNPCEPHATASVWKPHDRNARERQYRSCDSLSLPHEVPSSRPCGLGVYCVLIIERVKVANHLVEAGRVGMGVDLRGLDAGMAEQLLQHAQIRAP